MMARLKEEMSITEIVRLGTVVVGITVIIMTLRASDSVQNEILNRLETGQTDHEKRITKIERVEREEKIFENGRKAGMSGVIK